MLAVIALILLAPSVLAALRGDDEAAEGLRYVFLVGATVGLVVLVWWLVVALPRRDALAVRARMLGLRHSRRDPFDLLGLPFALFRAPFAPRRASNVMWGVWNGLDVKLFDLFVGRSNDPPEVRPNDLSCAVTTVPSSWPRLVIQREWVDTRLPEFIGRRDLEFESEAFNRAYEVRSDDPRFANALLDARMIAWLLELAGVWGFEVVQGNLLCYTRRRQPWELEEVLSALKAFHERVPTAVTLLYPPPATPPRPDTPPDSTAPEPFG